MKRWQFSKVLIVSVVLPVSLLVNLTACTKAQANFFTQPKKPVTWQVQAAPTMVIYTGGNDINLLPAKSPKLNVAILTKRDDPPVVRVVLENAVVTVKVTQKALLQSKSLISVEVPANLRQLTLIGSGKVSAFVLPRSLQQLTVEDSNSLLLAGKGLNLQQLTLKKVKQARIDGFASTDLLASLSDCGPVALNGNVGIRELQVNNSKSVSISWVNSKHLTLSLDDKDSVYLAGVATLLEANVDDQAHLDAKYLRAQKAFVNTKEKGKAEVMVIDSLNAYAQDKSNIYYYQKPKLLARYYQGSGSILYMGEKPPPCLAPACKPMPNSLPG